MSDERDTWLDDLSGLIENYLHDRQAKRDVRFVLMIYARNEHKENTRSVELVSNGKIADVHGVLKAGTEKVEAALAQQRQRENTAEISLVPANDEEAPNNGDAP